MQASDLNFSYLLFSENFRFPADQVDGIDYIINTFKSIKLVKVQNDNLGAFFKMLNISPKMKVMDNFYLFDYGESDNETHALFFDFISGDYETLINKKVNKDLIRIYFEQISKVFKSKKRLKILDLGSGTGISARVKADNPLFSNIDLYGYEISSQMEKLSKLAGLEMLNTRSLTRHQDYYFDAVFGSYSFHFITGNAIYKTIWQKLRIGGIVVANFHKLIGLENALIFFKEIGADIKKVGSYENGEIYQFKKLYYPFITYEETAIIISKYMLESANTKLLMGYLTKYSIIPSYEYDQEEVYLKADITRLKPFFKQIKTAQWEFGSLELYDQIYTVDSNGLRIEFSQENKLSHDNFNPALIISLLMNDDGKIHNGPPIYFPVSDCIRITIRSRKLKKIFEEANADRLSIDSARATIFANSASYMGSKKALRHFLFTSIKNTVPEFYKAIDLMCGAGAVASILAMRYDTYVSDAMAFSRTLAVVQGSGYTIERAKIVQEQLKISIKANLDLLADIYTTELEKEDDFFHMRIDNPSKREYDHFCRQYTFTNPTRQNRYFAKQNGSENLPYELFTLAYSNTFFGIKQSLQIDSLRYAIEQLKNPIDKNWALGALIATVSAVANTYAGHFAQPKYKDTASLSDSEFIRLIEQRSLSIFSEFEARFMAFAHESESKNLSIIKPIVGPWKQAIEECKELFGDQNNFIYVDAPYTRDEYSRYYHVLETLIDYQYHNLTGLGKIPEKKTGSRFKSNFFTRDILKLKREFLDLFTTILKNGSVCGWSYSNSAAAECLQIIYEVVSTTNCAVQSFEIPYEYKGQGGRLPKQIKEYFILFSPT